MINMARIATAHDDYVEEQVRKYRSDRDKSVILTIKVRAADNGDLQVNDRMIFGSSQRERGAAGDGWLGVAQYVMQLLRELQEQSAARKSQRPTA
jgi:hypothetical protein